MNPEDDIPLADGVAEAEAAFTSGFPETSVEKPAAKAAEKPPAKDKPESAATPRVEATPEPEKFVQISEKDWAEVKAAAAKTASYDQQLSRAFGTIGNMQKMLNEQRAKEAAGQPAAAAAIAKKFEIPKEAFQAMERDFPELAAQTRAAMEAALSNLPAGANPEAAINAAKALVAEQNSKRELLILEDRHPNWREIVGAVDASTGQPPPDNAFRRWLGTKDVAYQERINGSELADVIGRAIRTFQRETAAPAKPNGAARDTARAERIAAAVQPRGDRAGVGASKSENEEFEAGFASR
jgi:hypothetical protein